MANIANTLRRLQIHTYHDKWINSGESDNMDLSNAQLNAGMDISYFPFVDSKRLHYIFKTTPRYSVKKTLKYFKNFFKSLKFTWCILILSVLSISWYKKNCTEISHVINFFFYKFPFHYCMEKLSISKIQFLQWGLNLFYRETGN